MFLAILDKNRCSPIVEKIHVLDKYFCMKNGCFRGILMSLFDIKDIKWYNICIFINCQYNSKYELQEI